MKTNKKIDCVKMMREIRNEIDSEISKMNPEQILNYIKKGKIEFETKVSNGTAH